MLHVRKRKIHLHRNLLHKTSDIPGVDGLRDRSSKPHSLPSQIGLATADDVERLRRERRTQEHIAAELGISRASVSRILKHRGLSLLSSLEPQEPHPRYERGKPGGDNPSRH